MLIFGLFIGVVFLIFIAIALMIGLSSSELKQEEQLGTVYKCKCEKCNFEISWRKQDVLAVKDYKSTYVLVCPNCNKTITAKKE